MPLWCQGLRAKTPQIGTTGRGEAGLEDAASAHILLTSEGRISLGTLIDWRRDASNPRQLITTSTSAQEPSPARYHAVWTLADWVILYRSSVSGRYGEGPCWEKKKEKVGRSAKSHHQTRLTEPGLRACLVPSNSECRLARATLRLHDSTTPR